MLIPRFTIRQLMLGMAIAAFVCAILGFAAQGNVYAYGLGIAILGLVIPLAFYAFVYWTLLLLSRRLPGAKTLPIGPQKPTSESRPMEPDSSVDPDSFESSTLKESL